MNFRVDINGWPIVDLDRPHWPRIQCEACNNDIACEYVNLDMLGSAWWELVPDKDPSLSLIGLCKKCFSVARSAEGRIKGYTFRDGKIKQYVKEELFGGDI